MRAFSDNRQRTTDNGHFGARRNEASKDIAESPTRSGTPKKFKSLSSTALVLKNNKYKKLSDKRPADAGTFDFDLKDSGTFVLAQDINFFESFTKNRKKLQKN